MSHEIQILAISPGVPSFAPSIHPAAIEAKRAAIECAVGFIEIGSHDDYTAAIDAQRRCVTLAKLAQASREEMKRPIIDAGRAIDAQARDYCDELDREDNRLGRLAAAYQERIREEQRRAKELAQEKEHALIVELSGKQMDLIANPDLSDGERELAIAAEQDRAVNAITQARMKVEELPKAAAGTRLLKPWKFQIIDTVALYSARPELCAVTPNMAAIRALIQHRDIPGVIRWQESKVSVRPENITHDAIISKNDY